VIIRPQDIADMKMLIKRIIIENKKKDLRFTGTLHTQEDNIRLSGPGNQS
jgi:hypothetical protein